MFNMSRKEPTNVLLIEDVESDAELIRLRLQSDTHENFNLIHAPNMAAALPILAMQNLNAVMLDLFLPDTEDLDGLSGIQAVAPNIPVLILTGRDDETLARTAVARGAQDYLVKDRIDAPSLQRSLHYAIQRKSFENAIVRQAYYDTLTGLPNRDLFHERLTTALARQQRSRQKISLMMLDLNGFKQINDGHGHAAGDAVLREIGWRIPQCLRPYDVAGRLGGDEFAVLIEDVTPHGDPPEIARKLIAAIERPIIMNQQPFTVGVSIGITVSSGDVADLSPDLMLHEADIAMYRAKAKGGSGFDFFTPPALPKKRAAATG